MRNVQSRPAQGHRTSLLRAVLVAGLIAAPLSLVYAQDPATQPPAQGAPAAQPAPPVPGLTFDGDAGLIFMQIKPDKTVDFESVLTKLHEALSKTDKPERKQQARGWRVYKSTEPGPSGNVLYIAVITPPLKGADYTVSKILAEVFPTDVQTIWPTYRDSFAAGQNRMNLSLVQDFGSATGAQQAPATPTPVPAQQ